MLPSSSSCACARDGTREADRIVSRAAAHGTLEPVDVALQWAATETKPSFTYRQYLPTANPKAAIAYDAEVVFLRLTTSGRLPPCRASPQASLFG
jgi:hypothetical protein